MAPWCPKGRTCGAAPGSRHSALYNFRDVVDSPARISTITPSLNIMATTKKPVKPAKPVKSAKLAKPAAPKAAPTINPVKLYDTLRTGDVEEERTRDRAGGAGDTIQDSD